MKSIVGRMSAVGFLVFILVAAASWTSILVQGNHEQEGVSEQLRYSFSFPAPTLNTITSVDGTFTKINLSGCLNLGKHPGDPVLPVKFIQLLLPPGTTVTSVSITGSLVELPLSGIDLSRNRLYPAQEEIPLGTDASSELRFNQEGFNQEVYSSNQLYPEQPYNAYHFGYSHGYTIFDIGLLPVRLIPAQGRIFYYPELTVTISLQDTISLNPFFRGTLEDEAWVKTLVCNPEMTARYKDQPTFEYPGGLCDPSDHYDYVIITTMQNSLNYWDTSEETPYNWDSLMQKHALEGMSCTLVTKQAIDACNDYYNTTPLFNDSQAHLREFCKDAYQDWGIKYILIGADAEYIPARLMDYGYETDVDADIYYSNLDNTFNADQDAYWGEEGDSGFDLYSELFLGRIPCDIPQDVSNWLTKSFYYTDSMETDYLENGGFFAYDCGGDVQMDDVIDFAAIKGTDHWFGPYPDQWPGWLGFLYGFETWNILYPENSFNLSVRWTNCDPNPGWNYGDIVQEFRNAINNDTVTLITGIGHANPEMSLDVYSTDWLNLYYNTKPFFISDLGNHCGDMDAADDGVLDVMLFSSDSKLAFGCLFNSGYSFAGGSYCTNASVALQTKLFWDYFFDLTNHSENPLNWQFGKGLAWSKDRMAPTLNWDSTWRGTLQDRLLFADPAQLLKPPHPLNPNHPPNPPVITWSPDMGLTINATDPDGDAIYYLIDWGDGSTSDWLGPYPSGKEITLMYTWVEPGTYTVKVKAKDIYDAASNWSDPLNVEIFQPQITIESLQGPLGITVKITNTGDQNLSQIQWNISITGGFVLVGASKSGLFASLPIETSKTVDDFILGLGKITITVNVMCAENTTATKTMNGLLLGIFVIGLQ